MTTEQNQPQSQEPSAPPSGPASAGQSQNHRRRRRRRKGKSAAQTNGQPGQQNQPQSAQQPQPQGQKSKASSQNRFFKKNRNGGGGPNGNVHGGGNGQQQGAGGRRKNRQRRQQVFVGPMDHSYRAANGNMADSPPSTIEFRGNSNGNGNIAYPEPQAYDAAPQPVREDAPTRIFCFIEDLFVLAKIQETAKKLGIKVGFVKADKDTVARLIEIPEDERPSLIVFDLNNANAKPLTLIPRLKSKLKRGTSVIGFLSHLQGDLKVKAIEAGCDMVMPRSAFSQNLPNLLRRHGLEEELEPIEA